MNKSKISIAFIRIQRSGSTSLSNSIKKYYGKGENNIIMLNHGYSYKVNIKDPFDMFPSNSFIFSKNNFNQIYGLIRNPFDILLSYYFHYTVGFDGWGGCNNIHGFSKWEEFLEAYLDPNFDWHIPPMKHSMFSFAYDKKHNLIMDDYFKLEELNKINNFLKTQNCPPLIKTNQSFRFKKQYYTLSQVKELNKIWKRDLKYFNYQYEGQ